MCEVCMCTGILKPSTETRHSVFYMCTGILKPGTQTGIHVLHFRELRTKKRVVYTGILQPGIDTRHGIFVFLNEAHKPGIPLYVYKTER